jgi:hydroxymethylglutaryl-CoA lyase
LLERDGIATGVDLPRLVETGLWLSERLGRETGSRVARAAR